MRRKPQLLYRIIPVMESQYPVLTFRGMCSSVFPEVMTTSLPMKRMLRSLKSYEFELWDTQKNTEYEIPDGEYISVTVPVKAGYTYSIEHLLDNGAMETIIPSVDGDTMTFSTHSFQSVRYCWEVNLW